MQSTENIIALATASGSGAIAVIRLSGPDAIQLADTRFAAVNGKKLVAQKSHTIHLGHIKEDTVFIDQVLISVLKVRIPTPVKMLWKYPVMVHRIFNNVFCICS